MSFNIQDSKHKIFNSCKIFVSTCCFGWHVFSHFLCHLRKTSPSFSLKFLLGCCCTWLNRWTYLFFSPRNFSLGKMRGGKNNARMKHLPWWWLGWHLNPTPKHKGFIIKGYWLTGRLATILNVWMRFFVFWISNQLMVWVGGLDSWNPLMKGIGNLGCTPIRIPNHHPKPTIHHFLIQGTYWIYLPTAPFWIRCVFQRQAKWLCFMEMTYPFLNRESHPTSESLDTLWIWNLPENSTKAVSKKKSEKKPVLGRFFWWEETKEIGYFKWVHCDFEGTNRLKRFIPNKWVAMSSDNWGWAP